MINIFKIEVSTNGRSSIIKTLDVDYKINKRHLNIVREVLMNSFSEELEEDIYVYLHYKEIK